MTSRSLEKKAIELAGLYAVASKLCEAGYLVTVATTRTYPAIDLIVHDLPKNRYVGVQAKTRKSRKKYYFAPSEPQPTVFVNIDLPNPPMFFVHGASSVKELLKKESAGFLRREFVEPPGTQDAWENIWT